MVERPWALTWDSTIPFQSSRQVRKTFKGIKSRKTLDIEFGERSTGSAESSGEHNISDNQTTCQTIAKFDRTSPTVGWTHMLSNAAQVRILP